MEFYTPREIARAAGVSTEQVVIALEGRGRLVPHDQAVRIGRLLTGSRPSPFAMFLTASAGPAQGRPLLLSSTIHVIALAAAVVVSSLGPAPRASTVETVDERPQNMRLVFVAVPGPGGGGGGGGLRQKAAPPKALRDGHETLSSPLPPRRPPVPVEPAKAPPEPEPAPIAAETLPIVAAPVVTAPADNRDRAGVLQQARTEANSRGPGQDGGVGTGAGTGVGSGDGAGIGPGSGGGTGGGPFRPGSGITAPRLLKEVKGDYTEEARRSGIAGDVVLEIVVRRDGGVGDVRVLHGLGGGLNERAIQAVKQWRFTPATRQGAAVDVVVEVAMEFKLR
jgi:periplasmic protein TonB